MLVVGGVDLALLHDADVVVAVEGHAHAGADLDGFADGGVLVDVAADAPLRGVHRDLGGREDADDLPTVGAEPGAVDVGVFAALELLGVAAEDPDVAVTSSAR